MRVLLVPCDTRPPTLELPRQLARMAGLDLVTPPPACLNHLGEPGDLDELRRWLTNHAPDADALIVSLETLTLGGLIPARRVSDSLEDALERLDVLRKLNIPRVLAHGVIVRVAHDDDPLEEKPYYGEWGAKLRAYPDARASDVPPDILADWLGTRARNHAMHEAAIELLREGVLERLHLTLDDTTPGGLASLDRQRLEAKLDDLGLWNRAEIYPGADEVSCALLARLLNPPHVRTPVRVVLSSPTATTATTLYEDRPLGPLVSSHLRACGCEEVAPGESGAFTLFVNAPAVGQGRAQPDFETVDTPARNLPAFAEEVRQALERGEGVVLADVAYPNGAERRLMTLLRGAPLHRLLGYAAWNTAGNSLGSAIATGVCALKSDDAARIEALFSRLVDDWLYQAEVRGEVWNALTKPDLFDLGDEVGFAEEEIDRRLRPRTLALWTQRFAPHHPTLRLTWNPPKLAWPRLFTGVFPLEVSRA